MTPESPKSFHKEGEQLDIDYEKVDFVDLQGRTWKDLQNIPGRIGSYIKEHPEKVYCDTVKKSWRIINRNNKDKTLDEWISIIKAQEHKDDIETNSGWHR